MAHKFEHTSATTREFTLEFLQQITDNFSEEHIIGRGGYGTVYKGVLENGEEIALKKLRYMPGLDDTQFRNEFNNLMRAQHQNITQLVGYCYYTGHQRVKLNGEYVFALVEERVLCFEYLQGGSLDKYISDESSGLDWHTRFKIITGVCEGLNYLHNGCKDPIYHLDLKPANILLDKNKVPKIGDFGLSRLFPSGQTHITVKIIGTLGYMPPEYIERCEITSKYDVFSLGVIIVRIIAGDEGYSKCAQMPSHEFLEHIHANWETRFQATMSLHTSEQIKTCIETALKCLQVDREKRPTVAEIADKLNKVNTAESSVRREVARNRSSNSECRGRIVFSATNRLLLPFDIFSCPSSPSPTDDELQLTDGLSYNYNGRPISAAALKTLLKSTKLADEGGATDEDVDMGHVSGLVFVSERDDGLETLYIALCFKADNRAKIFALADIFGAADFSGARLEDSGCIGGGYNMGSRSVGYSLIYVSTKEPVQELQSPWTVVYKTNLTTGKTERLTPEGVFDLSPAVSPSGRMVAVASFQNKSWNGETENLRTDIYVMNVDGEGGQGLGRKLLIKNGGWPSWGSDNIIFFHRGTYKRSPYTSRRAETSWAVFRYNISTEETVQVTPHELDAVTPAAISETKVAVATFCQNSRSAEVPVHYRHIEIFDTSALGLPPVQITQSQNTRPECDHYNPFVLEGGARIGYHRCRSNLLLHGDTVHETLYKLESPANDVGLFRVCGVFPTISKDGSKLAFVDQEWKKVWLADSQGLRIVCEDIKTKMRNRGHIFAPVWNQNPDKDILYLCIGFKNKKKVHIYSIRNVSGPLEGRRIVRLTHGKFNNTFPSSSPDGNTIVFCSTKDGGEKKFKNLYITLDRDTSEFGEGWERRLTKGQWTDTHCQWSPSGDWIVFSRSKPWGAGKLDPRCFSLYLLKATNPTVVIRVMSSVGDMGCHINHPVFSPDGRSIAVTADLAAVSVDPISLPTSMHAAQPYGDIFVLDIDPDDLKKNEDVKEFRRITHSRYECGMPAWYHTFAARERNAWNMLQDIKRADKPVCPYVVHPEGGDRYQMTGHLGIPRRMG